MTTIPVRATVCVLQYHCNCDEFGVLHENLANCRLLRVVYREQQARNMEIYCPKQLCMMKPSWKEDLWRMMEQTVEQVVFSTIEIEIFSVTHCLRYDMIPGGVAFRERVEGAMEPSMGQDSIIVATDLVEDMGKEEAYVVVHSVTIEYKQGREGGFRRMEFTGKVALNPFRKCASVPPSLSQGEILVFFKAIKQTIGAVVRETKMRVWDFCGIMREYMYLCSVNTVESADKFVLEHSEASSETGVVQWVPIPGVVGGSVFMSRSILVYHGSSLQDARLACVKQSPVEYHVGDQEAYWPEMLWAGHPTWKQDFLATAMEYTENLVYGSILVELVLQNAREVRTYEFASTGLFFKERRAAADEELASCFPGPGHAVFADEAADPTGTRYVEMGTIPVPGFQLTYGPREHDVYKRVFFEGHVVRPCSRIQVPTNLDSGEVCGFVNALSQLSLNVAHETQISVRDHNGFLSVLSPFCSVQRKVLGGLVV